MTTTAATPRLLTAEEYRLLPDSGRPTELCRGRVVEMNMPAPRHGRICLRIGQLLLNYLDKNDLGVAVSNDAAVVTQRDPDSVRGADIAFYSYARVPRGPWPQGYFDVVPDLVFEVRSLTDRWPQVLAKVSEYLDAGVKLVCVIDDQTSSAVLYHGDLPEVRLRDDEELDLGEVIPGFRVRVGAFFE